MTLQGEHEISASKQVCECQPASVQCTVYPFWQASLPLLAKMGGPIRPTDRPTYRQTVGRAGARLPAAHTNKAKWQWQTQTCKHAQKGGTECCWGDKCLFGTLRNHKAKILRLLNDLISMRVYFFRPPSSSLKRFKPALNAKQIVIAGIAGYRKCRGTHTFLNQLDLIF